MLKSNCGLVPRNSSAIVGSSSAQIMYVYVMWIGKGNFFPSWDRTRVPMEGSRRLKAWAMARPGNLDEPYKPFSHLSMDRVQCALSWERPGIETLTVFVHALSVKFLERVCIKTPLERFFPELPNIYLNRNIKCLGTLWTKSVYAFHPCLNAHTEASCNYWFSSCIAISMPADWILHEHWSGMLFCAYHI
jgi:hypothetical protein